MSLALSGAGLRARDASCVDRMDEHEQPTPDLASRLEAAADPGDPSRRSFIRAGTGVIVGAAALAGANRQLKILRSESNQPIAGSDEGRSPAYADIELAVNGQMHALRVPHQRTLLLALREDLGLTGTKKSCNLGQCGACTVLMDGLPVYSCMLLALDATGHDITTIEGIGTRRWTSPGARGVRPPHGQSVWPLHAGDDPVGRCPHAADSAAHRGAGPPGPERKPVSMRQLSQRDRGSAVGRGMRAGAGKPVPARRRASRTCRHRVVR